ncbi:Hexokinase HKDC1 [Acropora cervicornis]|uniref:Phosphotransferase n=1 Tax=Acropora cervicornis TaxID=6130 RepID=A0AAD9R320_ACRCE|nr:Hexokinase HKDC1 [Acropora cervicornis]
MFSVLPYASGLISTLINYLTGKDQVFQLLSTFELPKESLELIVNLLLDDFTKGLSADEQERSESPVKMLLTYVRAIPDGTEHGEFLALDLGGTNFRVLLISLNRGEVTMESDIYPLDQALMTSDGKTLFGYIAGCISLFVKKNKIKDRSLPLGFTFSFPNTSVDVVALVNDTTGTMMSCALSNPNVSAALILGTGSNACYMESLDNIPKWDGDQGHPQEVIVNTEWGAFGDNGSWNHLRTEFDEKVDSESLNPGMQLFEKMISGMYLGELVRLVCLNLIEKKLLFNGKAGKFTTKNSFPTKFVSEVESLDRYKINEVLNEMRVIASERDVDILQRVCAVVSVRAARLAAAGVVAIAKKTQNYKTTIAVDGSLFKKHPQFKRYMEETLKELLPEGEITLMLSEDGSGKGAALIAAVASKY